MILVAMFVLVCSLVTLSLVAWVFTHESRETEQTMASIEHAPREIELVSRRMDVPQKHPLLRTRHTRSLP